MELLLQVCILEKKVISVSGIIEEKFVKSDKFSIPNIFIMLAGGRGGWNRGRGRGGGHHARGAGAARNVVVPVPVVPDSNAIEKLKTIEDHSDKQWTECMLSNLMHCNQIGKKQIWWKI